MNAIYDRLLTALNYIREITDFVPEIAITLGSGMGEFAEEIDEVCSIDYHDIPGFPVSTVLGHRGRFIMGYLEGRAVVVMQGRVHYYEGYEMSEVVMPLRIMKMMGAKKVIFTSAAGAINEEFCPGDIMLVTDHISSLIPNPLRGANVEELGTRFTDMSYTYSKVLAEKALKAAEDEGIKLQQGVYIQTTGPSYETPAEIRAFASMGADAVGMSMAGEAIAAAHMSMEILGFACLSNMAAGISSERLDHSDIAETVSGMGDKFIRLMKASVKNI